LIGRTDFGLGLGLDIGLELRLVCWGWVRPVDAGFVGLFTTLKPVCPMEPNPVNLGKGIRVQIRIRVGENRVVILYLELDYQGDSFPCRSYERGFESAFLFVSSLYLQVSANLFHELSLLQ
jgi:hypothetical protein